MTLRREIIGNRGSSKSAEDYKRYDGLTAGGVQSNFRFRLPHPLYISKALGSKLWDVDENEILDCLVSNGACILGHNDPDVTKSVASELESGLTVGYETELSFRLAGSVNEIVPSAEAVKFSNTGTEAVMHAMQIARGFTRRDKIIKTEGCYHGWHDELHVSVHPKISSSIKPSQKLEPVPESEGFQPEAFANVLIVPYNDSAAAEALIKEYKDNVAAIIVEPVMFNSGCVYPNEGYLQELREITEKAGVMLIFDEVISGFRLAPGGAQEFYEVIPDVSVFGKAIANGYPLSAVVGRKDVMDVARPMVGRVAYAGTYNASQLSLAASSACLRKMKNGEVSRKLHSDTSKLIERFEQLAADIGIEATMQGVGGQFQIYFTNARVDNYRTAASSSSEKYSKLCQILFESGILFHQSYLFHHGTSLAHSSQDLEYLISVLDTGLNRIKKAG